jgi:hypothetical protein
VLQFATQEKNVRAELTAAVQQLQADYKRVEVEKTKYKQVFKVGQSRCLG